MFWSLRLDLSDVFSWLGWGFGLGGEYHTCEVGYMKAVWGITGDVNLQPSVRVTFARILHCIVTISPSHLLEVGASIFCALNVFEDRICKSRS